MKSRFPKWLKTLETKGEEGPIRKDSGTLQAGGPFVVWDFTPVGTQTDPENSSQLTSEGNSGFLLFSIFSPDRAFLSS